MKLLELLKQEIDEDIFDHDDDTSLSLSAGVIVCMLIQVIRLLRQIAGNLDQIRIWKEIDRG